jgi:hypothetical protein
MVDADIIRRADVSSPCTRLRQIVGDGVYCGPVTIAHRSPKQLYKWTPGIQLGQP